MVPLEADDYETVDSADEDDDWDDQYGEVVVEGDFDGNASDAGGSEPEKPDKRVWGIDNEALEALKAKTAKLPRPGSLMARPIQPGEKLGLPTHYTPQYRIWTTVQEFKEKSRIFPWDQIFRSQPGPSLASYTVPPYIQSSGLVKSEIAAGGTLQYGAYDNTPRYPNNPNPNPQHAQASSMSLQMPMPAVPGAGRPPPCMTHPRPVSGPSEEASIPRSASVSLASSSGHGSLDFSGPSAAPTAGSIGSVGSFTIAERVTSRKWDDHDDTLLLALHTKWGGNWEAVVSRFNQQPDESRTRTKKAMQHRFSTLQRARRATEASAATATDQLNGISPVNAVPRGTAAAPVTAPTAFKTALGAQTMGGFRAADAAASDVPAVPQLVPPLVPAGVPLVPAGGTLSTSTAVTVTVPPLPGTIPPSASISTSMDLG